MNTPDDAQEQVPEKCESYVGNLAVAFPCGLPVGHEMPHVYKGSGHTRYAGQVGPLRDIAYTVTWEAVPDGT